MHTHTHTHPRVHIEDEVAYSHYTLVYPLYILFFPLHIEGTGFSSVMFLLHSCD